MREFVEQRFGLRLRRSSCRTYLHRLGFVLKRPKKRLLKADEPKREAFVHEYVALQRQATATKARIFFVDEAHFYADVDLHAKWVLKGEPAFVESTSPRWGEKASYYSAVCPATGEVDAMPLEGNSSSETSVAFLKRLRKHYSGPLIIIWDNGPAHGGDAVRGGALWALRTPGLRLRLVRLPSYSPDFNGGARWAQAIWRWIREEVTANVCFGTKARVRAHVDHFFSTIADRAEEAIQRCRTALQASADALTQSEHACYVDPIAV